MRVPAPLLASLTCFASLLSSPVFAHNGAVVAKASFCLPPPPGHFPTDASGVEYHYVPRYAPEEADQHYRFAWQDGDMDPTGKFTFYYVDHDLPVALRVDYVDGTGGTQGIGKLMKSVDGREARDVYVSCACVAQDGGGDLCDAGILPNCVDGGARWCDNWIDWDTSQVPDGVYWIAAVNNDPPYHLYNMSEAPIRVSHGTHKPPAVMVVKPDGYGSAETLYRVTALVAGEGKLTMNVAWGIDNDPAVTNPLHVIASKVPITPASDGTVTYDWDVSKLPNEAYFIEVTVTDDTGASSYSDSRQGIGVFHPPVKDGGSAVADLAATMERGDLAQAGGAKTGGCGCRIGEGRGGASRRGSVRGMFAALIAIAFAIVTRGRAGRLPNRRRRAAPPGARSGCTGSGT